MSRFLLLTAILAAGPAYAQTGPGLGNLTYQPQEVFAPVGFIESPQGHGNVTMVQGYLMVIYSSDAGGNASNGGIEFWDISDPRAPLLVVAHDNVDTHGLREAHGFSLSWYGPQLLLAAQAVDGIQIWDVTDPLNIMMLSYLDLVGIDRGDYSGDWWVFWQAPYLFVAGVDSGLYVVDVTDPLAPVQVAQVATGDLGGVSPAQVFVLGNLAVVGEAQGSALATLDVSVPDQPRLLRQAAGRSGYSHLFAGDGKILTSGNVPPRAHFLQVTADGDITLLDSAGFFFNSGGYGSYQDGFFHSGFSNQYVKFSVNPPQEVGSGSSERNNRDEDFSTVLGNVVVVSDDHGVGTAIIPHQPAPDTTPPSVEWMHPPADSTGVALTSRIGLSFSDHVDATSLNPSTVWLEDDTQTVVPTRLSVQMGLVNLSPLADLDLLRTYTVVAEGVRDVAGNASARFEASITTGDGSIPMSPTAAITNVDVSIAFGSYALGIFAEDKEIYSDRNYTFTAQFPGRFDRQAYIQTANNDKNNFLTNFLSFDLLAPAEVLVLFDSRATSLPNWMAGFTPTGETVVTTDATFDVFTQNFAPGSVTLGGNGASGSAGANSMYSVVIIPEPVPCDIDLSPIETGTVALSAMGPAAGTYEWRIRGQTFTDTNPTVYLPPGRHPVTLSVMDGVLGATCGGVKIVHRPLVATPARTSGRLLWLEGTTVNVNPDNGTVSRASPNGVAWETSVNGRPESVARRGDELWVTVSDPAQLVVLDAQGQIDRTITLPHGTAPFSVLFDPDGTPFVTLFGSGELIALGTDDTVVRRATVPKARGLTWFDDRLYVTRFISSAERGEVHVFDATSFDRVETIGLALDPGPDTEAGSRGVPNYLSEVTIAPDGHFAFVPGKKDNVLRGLFRDGEPLTFESRVRTIVSRFTVDDHIEDLAGRLDVNDRELVLATAISPHADLLFVASQGVNTVDVFDIAKGERVSQFEVARAPQGLSLDVTSGRLAVYGFLARSVDYYDVSGMLDGTSNAAVPLGAVSTVASEQLDAQVLLGKRIFHDAIDTRMSRDSYISCASCHLEGKEDGQVWDFTQAGEGLRNTISLQGRAGVGHGNVHWTANFDEIQDFENDIRNAFGGTGFLSDTDFAATEDPLGAPKAGLSPELDALAAYVTSLDRTPSSPHREADGTLTLPARRGREIFGTADCARCHAGERFADGLRHDVGTVRPSSGLGINAPLEGVGFDTPTLRGIWDTPPYLHDGSAATLLDVLDAHDEVPQLTAAEEDDLVAYLLALDDSSLPPEAPCDTGPNECVEMTTPPMDAGVDPPDAGQKPPDVDGGMRRDDAGTSELPVPEEAGCGCTGQTGDHHGSWVLVLLVATLLLRRRRK